MKNTNLPLDSCTKDFKYTLRSKEGKIILQEIVTFGSIEAVSEKLER